MDWQSVPNWWQWIGLFATLIGTVISAASFVSATLAARSAEDAKEAANEAKAQAIRLGRVLQLTDLLGDVQEVQILLARRDFEAIGAKASHLRGRVVRFKRESFGLLEASDVAGLDLARDQLESIGDAATIRRGEDENRIGRIQRVLAKVNEALNKAYAVHHAGALGIEQ